MMLENPKYDAAISFLAADESIAAELNRKLISEAMSVFFFPERQKELAGTDGMESMRKPFYEDSRLMIVLYRDGWGKTRWTGIEERAIKEACFDGEWRRLFFVALDRTSTLPGWLPPNYVRYNWEDFGPEQVIGIIKARVLENGWKPTPMTAREQARISQQEEEYRVARSSIERQPGIEAVKAEAKALLEAVKTKCSEIVSDGNVDLKCEIDARQFPRALVCIITNRKVSVSAIWNQTYSNTINEGAGLSVYEFNGPLLLPGETGVYMAQPERLKEVTYKPDLFRTGDLGWSLNNSDDIITTSKMAEQIVMRFLKLLEMRRTGKLKALSF